MLIKRKNESSSSMLSARSMTRKISKTPKQREVDMTRSPADLEVVLRDSPSPIESLYRSEEFQVEYANQVAFHVAMNILNLRRRQKMSQVNVAKKMGTSQAAIARIEGGQDNITLGTLQRLVEALDGKFYVSIAPKDLAVVYQPWWDQIQPISGIEFKGMVSRQQRDTTQLIAAFELTHAGFGLTKRGTNLHPNQIFNAESSNPELI